MLPRVEKELRSLQAEGKAGKTITNYSEALTAFCDWCVQRGYLAEDPLKALGSYDTTPQVTRRAMTDSEIICLLEACPPHRRLLYETAFLSGLRANELRSLTQSHLDEARCGLNLDAEWTKNRKPGFQHLPSALVDRLRSFGDEGVAERLYEKYYARRDATRRAPANALLFVPSSTLSRDFDKDLKTADVLKWTPAGKLDFHAIRLAYINLVLDSDISAREAQAMARHASPDMTFNVYGRARHNRMAEAVEQIATRLSVPDRVPSVYRLAAGAERDNATAVNTGSCVSQGMVEPRGIEPRSQESQDSAESPQSSAKVVQFSALRWKESSGHLQNCALLTHNQGTSPQSMCVPSVHHAPDLASLVAMWDDLPDLIRARILELARTDT